MDAKSLEGLTWVCEDVRDMPNIESRSIDVAFDKGTLDAMIHGSPWDPPDEVKDNTGRYMKEVSHRDVPFLVCGRRAEGAPINQTDNVSKGLTYSQR